MNFLNVVHQNRHRLMPNLYQQNSRQYHLHRRLLRRDNQLKMF
jgi:hypothetical protein